MVDPITTLGGLLEKPHLEDDTIKMINEALRQLVKPYIQMGGQKELPPQELAKRMLGPNVLEEWLNGKQGKGGET